MPLWLQFVQPYGPVETIRFTLAPAVTLVPGSGSVITTNPHWSLLVSSCFVNLNPVSARYCSAAKNWYPARFVSFMLVAGAAGDAACALPRSLELGHANGLGWCSAVLLVLLLLLLQALMYTASPVASSALPMVRDRSLDMISHRISYEHSLNHFER